MKIAGFKKQSLIDYPGLISSVIFTQGCNFRCPYCHNPELVLPEKYTQAFEEDEIFSYLNKYKKLLDAVCITGGEPTLHKDLPLFITKVRDIGLKVKLDTNGTNPIMLEDLLNKNLIDFVAMDIKHILEHNNYGNACGVEISEQKLLSIISSVDLLKASSIPHQYRTTAVSGLHTKRDLFSLKNKFDNEIFFQNYRSGNIISSEHNLESFQNEFIDKLNIRS